MWWGLLANQNHVQRYAEVHEIVKCQNMIGCGGDS